MTIQHYAVHFRRYLRMNYGMSTRELIACVKPAIRRELFAEYRRDLRLSAAARREA